MLFWCCCKQGMENPVLFLFKLGQPPVQPHQVKHDKDENDHQQAHDHVYLVAAAEKFVDRAGFGVLLLNGFRYCARCVLSKNAGKGKHKACEEEISKSFSHEGYF